jgi:membrane associated rhomboid family serine protease
MNAFLRDMKMQFGTAVSLYRLMLLNIGLFLIIMIFKTISFLTGMDIPVFEKLVMWLSLPSALDRLMLQPWSIISYMFLHTGVLHILFNMLILYWSGRLFTEYLGSEKLWATYVLGGITGGLLYLASYNLLPVFSGKEAYLMGASAGVVAVMVAIATLLPDYIVHLLLFGPVRLKYVALVSVLLYFISIPGSNSGGEIAHLGGAAFGFVMIRQLRKGRDLTAWLRGFSRRLSTNPSRRKLYRVIPERKPSASSGSLTQENIDRILDKINKSGFDSLTKEEKEVLYKASGKRD